MNRTAAKFPAHTTIRAREQRDAILAAHVPQVEFLARRIHRRLPAHVPLEDLVNEGLLGMIDALAKFDPARRVQFQSYAQFRIQGAILDGLRNLDWCPREVRKQARRLEQAHDALNSLLGRSATREERAARAGLSLRAFENLLGEIRRADMVSLQGCLFTEGNEQGQSRFEPADTRHDPFESYVRSELRERLAAAIARLPERERQLLALYYYEELTMREVGEVLGVGETRICQLHGAAIAKLREELRALLPLDRHTARVKAA